MNIPDKYIEPNPNSQTVYLAGTAINISAIARENGLNKSYLSRIFSGSKVPSMTYSRQLAEILGLGMDEFVILLDARRQ